MVSLILKVDDTEMRFPVTPPSVSMGFGREVQTYSLIGIGQHTEYGEKTAESYTLTDLLLPGKDTVLPMAQPSTIGASDPESYIKLLQSWQQEEKEGRLIAAGSAFGLNASVIIKHVTVTQRGYDGSCYLTLTLIDHEKLKEQKAATDAKSKKKRESKTEGKGVQSYTVAKGDTLWSICKKYYQNGTLAYKLAAYNGIKNADYIKAGQKLKIPEKDRL